MRRNLAFQSARQFEGRLRPAKLDEDVRGWDEHRLVVVHPGRALGGGRGGCLVPAREVRLGLRDQLQPEARGILLFLVAGDALLQDLQRATVAAVEHFEIGLAHRRERHAQRAGPASWVYAERAPGSSPCARRESASVRFAHS